MGTIQFKRGTTCSVENYTESLVGEPIYDYETGILYVKNIYGEMLPIGVSGIALEGPTTIYPGGSYSYIINNFSSFRTYSFDHNLGSDATITRNGKNITIDVGTNITKSELELEISVDNMVETIDIPFGLEGVITGSFSSHSDGQTDVSITPTFTGSSFETNPPGYDTHESTDWQLALDGAFTNIVEESLNDTVNLTNWSPSSPLEPDTTYYLRYRYNGSTLGPGNWIVMSFTTEDVYILSPNITSHSNGDDVTLTPLIVTSFDTSPTGIDTHQDSDWEVATDSSFNNIIEQNMNTVSNKISWTPSNLDVNNTYYVRVRHRGNLLDASDWKSVTLNTGYVSQPSFSSHSDGQTDISIDPTFVSSSFATNPSGLTTHASTDWQISANSNFTAIMQESLNDTVNLTSWTPSTLSSDQTYYVRVKYNGANLGDSAWEEISLTTTDVSISTPSFSSHSDGQTDISIDPTFVSSSFATVPSGLDTHASTDWQISTDSGFSTIVQESLGDTVNLTSWTPSTLSLDQTYYVRVKYIGDSVGASPWGQISLVTTDYVGPVELTHSELRANASNSSSPYDVSGDDFIITADASQNDYFYISGFGVGDRINFINTPTGDISDVSVTNAAFGDNEAVLSCGGVNIYLSNLSDDAFVNPGTFKDIYGINSLIVEGQLQTVTLSNSDLVSDATNSSNPYNVSDTDYSLEIDASQTNSFYISHFDTGDAINFINTSTGDISDVSITNTTIGDSQATLVCDNATVYLSNLSTDNYNTPTEFKSVYGQNSLTVEGGSSGSALTHSDLRANASDSLSPYDVSDGDYTLRVDVSQSDYFYISGFDVGDVIEFENTPTGSISDVSFTNAAFGDGEAVLSCSGVSIYLSNLSDDAFVNPDTFKGIYGLNSLVVIS